MEAQVKARLLETRSAALASPRSAEAWGRYGMVAHAHELWRQAAAAYRKAQTLDPNDVRWPYYLGDVASVEGTDLAEAEASFRRAIAMRPGYAPAHMRLGNVLIALGRNPDAAVELERALRLAPDLQPARVALAQVRLAEGDLDTSEQLLERVLASEPKHGQALSTLGRVYMRQGRREQAREIAERARSAASYNLYSDPLMGQVVDEGVSTVQIWERAKSFLENENYEQAAIGLRRVLQLQPSNAEAHLQLAMTYGSLGDLERARYHLERLVALDPTRIEARVDLGRLYLERNEPAKAIEHLRAARDLDATRAETAWLLGKALLATGDLEEGFEVLETGRRTGTTPPAWVEKEWGLALAQNGQAEPALTHFRAALALTPNDPETLFYSGLALEGLGRTNEAVRSYCASLAQRSDSPAAVRLEALERTCS